VPVRSQSWLRHWFTRLAALAAVALALLSGAASASAATPAEAAALVSAAVSASAAVSTSAAVTAAVTGTPSGHVVVVNIDGLMWSDITQSGTPTLYSLVGKSDVASLVTRAAPSNTCPADGWLTLNSGARSTGGMVHRYPVGTPITTRLVALPNLYCAPLPTPPSGTPTVAESYSIPDFSSYTSPNSAFTYAPVFGSLQAPLAKAGSCVAASGPGALLGAADSTGHVSDYLGAPNTLTDAKLTQCALTLVDLGGLSDTEKPPSTQYKPAPLPQREPTYRLIDAQLAAILPHLPADATLVVVGLADANYTAHLHVAMVSGQAAGTDFNGQHWLYTDSTRHAGLVQTLDLTPSLLAWTGLGQSQITDGAGKPFTGAAVTAAGSGPTSAAGAIVTQVWLSAAEAVFSTTNTNFISWMAHAIIALGWAAGCVFLIVRWLPERLSPGRFAARWAPLAHWRAALMTVIAGWATLLASSVPASFLVDFFPWPGSANPSATLYHTMIALSVLVAAAVAALWWFTPLRARPFALAGLIGCLTLAVIGIDVMTGSNLQAQTPYGLSYVIAGRFYGIGNSAVGVYCAAAMTGSAWIASMLMPARGSDAIPAHSWPRTFREALTGWLHRAVPGRLGLTTLPPAERTQRRRAVVAVGLIALFATAACGDPTWGSKFGGTIAMVPGFVLLLFLVAGLRITWRKLVVVAVSGVVVVTGFALVNYFQPANERSHFGNFVASVLNGTWTGIVKGKIQTNLGSINNDWFSHYVPWLLFWCLVLIVAPRLVGSRSLARSFALEPFLRCALMLSLLTVTLATFVDDSGILVPKMALFFAVPLGVLGVTLTLTHAPELPDVPAEPARPVSPPVSPTVSPTAAPAAAPTISAQSADQ
jgi:hypothetical protein